MPDMEPLKQPKGRDYDSVLCAAIVPVLMGGRAASSWLN